jgi:PilZ domain
MSESNPPPSNRRAALRRKPKSASKVLCVTGKFGLGPNVAVSLLDVSESGIRLVLQTPVPVGQEVEIGLEAPGERRPTTIPGQVIWCVPLADGNHCIGVQFSKALKYSVLQSLTYF